jgi:hypothetical protein
VGAADRRRVLVQSLDRGERADRDNRIYIIDAAVVRSVTSMCTSLPPSPEGSDAVQPDHGPVRLLVGHRRLRQRMGALGAEAVEQQIQVAPPGARGDLAGGLVDPAL